MSCLHVRPVTSVSFDIGISNLADWSITMRECVKYIHDPDLTLNFDLNVKFIDFVFRPQLFLSFDIVILCLACECTCITMVRCVIYINEVCMTLTFDSISKLYFHHEFESGKMSLLFDKGIPNFGIWVYHHETTCCVHSWL